MATFLIIILSYQFFFIFYSHLKYKHSHYYIFCSCYFFFYSLGFSLSVGFGPSSPHHTGFLSKLLHLSTIIIVFLFGGPCSDFGLNQFFHFIFYYLSSLVQQIIMCFQASAAGLFDWGKYAEFSFPLITLLSSLIPFHLTANFYINCCWAFTVGIAVVCPVQFNGFEFIEFYEVL